ncbi:hypothetical protein C5Y95_021060 [Escherichia coli]|nr:hypothetical protein [Escherichia coli]
MSSGAKVISAFIRETVAGTTPASGDWSLLKRTSWGVKPTQNKGENNEIGGSRMAQGATPGTVDVGGDVGTKFRCCRFNWSTQQLCENMGLRRFFE